MKDQALFIYSPEYLHYTFHPGHPFNQYRLQLTIDLLQSYGNLDQQQMREPRVATDQELQLIHTPAYIRTVKKLSAPSSDPESQAKREEYTHLGLGTEDNPIFERMHQLTALIVGGSLQAAQLIMEGQAKHVLHLAGGLHHGFPGKASGFCIYNDCSIAIQYIRQKYGARIMYIDTDAHHGDGVQWSFYDDPHVFTFSIHETGRYLFPGTGHLNERGNDLGYGCSLNLPLDAFTQDESWLSCFSEALEEALSFFKPDVIISQHGCDAHFWDPLTHLSLSMESYLRIPQIVKKWAEKYTQGRWLALGGGGYDHYRVVPRAWSLLWMVMSGHPITQQAIPPSWLAKYERKSGRSLPKYLLDTEEDLPHIPRKLDIEEKNEQMKQQALTYLRQQMGK